MFGFVKVIVIEHNVYLNSMRTRTKGDSAIMTEMRFGLMGFCSARCSPGIAVRLNIVISQLWIV